MYMYISLNIYIPLFTSDLYHPNPVSWSCTKIVDDIISSTHFGCIQKVCCCVHAPWCLITFMGSTKYPELHGVLARLGAIGAPAILFQLITLLYLNVGQVNVNLDMVEYFAGEQAVSCLACRSI